MSLYFQILYLKAANNNKASTALTFFLEAVQKHGFPLRYNAKNLLFTLEHRGLNQSHLYFEYTFVPDTHACCLEMIEFSYHLYYIFREILQ